MRLTVIIMILIFINSCAVNHAQVRREVEKSMRKYPLLSYDFNARRVTVTHKIKY